MKNAGTPKGYQTITPSLAFRDTATAIDWYRKVFNAEERMRMNGPDQKILHAELVIGDSVIFLTEENPKYMSLTPASTQGNSIHLYLYVENVDELIKKAAENGATVVMEPMDVFYGDRCGNIRDPFGYSWTVATHIKDVSEKEMKKMSEEMQMA